MDHYEFKVGDIIRCVSNDPVDHDCKNKIGKIINIPSNNYWCLVEFFEPVDGHNGLGRGKQGYCWNLKKEKIKLNHPLLKLFLKERKKHCKISVNMIDF